MEGVSFWDVGHGLRKRVDDCGRAAFLELSIKLGSVVRHEAYSFDQHIGNSPALGLLHPIGNIVLTPLIIQGGRDLDAARCGS